MRVSRKGFVRALVLLGMVVCGVAAGLDGGVAWAQTPPPVTEEKVGNNPFMCWTTGRGDSKADPWYSWGENVFGEGADVDRDRDSVHFGWGLHELEYVVDRDDYWTLGLDYRLEPADRVLGHGPDEGGVVGLVPETVKVRSMGGEREVERPVGALFSSPAGAGGLHLVHGCCLAWS